MFFSESATHIFCCRCCYFPLEKQQQIFRLSCCCFFECGFLSFWFSFHQFYFQEGGNLMLYYYVLLGHDMFIFIRLWSVGGKSTRKFFISPYGFQMANINCTLWKSTLNTCSRFSFRLRLSQTFSAWNNLKECIFATSNSTEIEEQKELNIYDAWLLIYSWQKR